MTYHYAKCICGYFEHASDENSAAKLLAAHVPNCDHPERYLLVPMWSIAWPYYHSEGALRWREGGPRPEFGLEMSWRVSGSHSLNDPFSPYSHGGMAKEWYLFA
jgi:hypothetical protein